MLTKINGYMTKGREHELIILAVNSYALYIYILIMPKFKIPNWEILTYIIMNF